MYHTTFPNYLCSNGFRDITYDEVYSAIMLAYFRKLVGPKCLDNCDDI